MSEIRLAAGLTKRALANSLGWHESKASRFESGTRAPSERDLRDWCAACGADGEAEDLISTARGIQGMYVEWRKMERTGLKWAQESVLPLWERTQRFRIYSPWLIPGPVQTASYITALLTAIRDRRGLIDDVPAAVKVRVDKQNIVYGNHTFAILLEESALRYRIGGTAVMAEQLGYLLNVMALPAVSIGIIPQDVLPARGDGPALWRAACSPPPRGWCSDGGEVRGWWRPVWPGGVGGRGRGFRATCRPRSPRRRSSACAARSAGR